MRYNKVIQIGDMLSRVCGSIAVVSHIYNDNTIGINVIHSTKKHRRYVGDRRIPTELIGVTWRVIA